MADQPQQQSSITPKDFGRWDLCEQIIAQFCDPSIPPAETWSKLASYHAGNGCPEAARWCSMRAAGHSPDECDRACRNPMNPLDPPEPERPAPAPAPRMER